MPSSKPTATPAKLSKGEAKHLAEIISEMDLRMKGYTLGEVIGDLTGLTISEIATLQIEYIERIRRGNDNFATLLKHMILVGAWIGIRHITRVMKGRES